VTAVTWTPIWQLHGAQKGWELIGVANDPYPHGRERGQLVYFS
jgi:hypothetical protein